MSVIIVQMTNSECNLLNGVGYFTIHSSATMFVNEVIHRHNKKLQKPCPVQLYSIHS